MDLRSRFETIRLDKACRPKSAGLDGPVYLSRDISVPIAPLFLKKKKRTLKFPNWFKSVLANARRRAILFSSPRPPAHLPFSRKGTPTAARSKLTTSGGRFRAHPHARVEGTRDWPTERAKPLAESNRLALCAASLVAFQQLQFLDPMIGDHEGGCGGRSR